MSELSFSLEGKVIGKGRPRLDRRSMRFHTDSRTAKYQKQVAWEAARARPKKWPLDKRTAYHVRIFVGHGGGHVVDLDNAAKSILDACNGILWPDDRQVESLALLRCRGVDDVGVVIVDAVKVPMWVKVLRQVGGAVHEMWRET